MADSGLSRLAMVITSQCESSEDHEHLSFLPPLDWSPGQRLEPPARLPVELYGQFLDPEAGACDPVPGLDAIEGIRLFESGSALVVNPTVALAKAALKHAFVQAGQLDKVLVVHYVGHGCEQQPTRDDTFHLLRVANSPRLPVDDDEGWNPYRQTHQLLKGSPEFPALPGFVLSVDACYASRARPEIAKWGRQPTSYVWIGASQDAEAFDGCFSETLLNLMREGDPTRAGLRPAPELRSWQVRDVANQRCRDQDSDDWPSHETDYLFITRNRAVPKYEHDLGLVGRTADRLRTAISAHYQPIDLATITEALDKSSFVVVTGGAGSGKTVLAAVLRDPPDPGSVRRLDAIAFLDTSTTLDQIANDLHPQLETIPRYRDLSASHERSSYDLQLQSPFDRRIAGPLRLLSSRDNLVIGLDGLDQLGTGAHDIIEEFRQLTADTGERLQILMTSRPRSAGGPIPDGAFEVAIPPLTREMAATYLASLDVPRDGAQVIIDSVDELNWLVLALAADQVTAEPDSQPSGDQAQLYEAIRAAAIADLGAANVQPVIDVLVASGQVAGVGPRLPFAVLAEAVSQLGGPNTLRGLNEVLAQERLYRIIERANPATDEEHVGLFHLTAITSLEPPPDRLTNAHRAISNALAELVKSDDSAP